MLFSGLLNKLFNRRSEGYKEEDKQAWADWNERRLAATESGKPFDDPQPVPGRRSRRRGRRRAGDVAAGAAAGAFLVGPPIDHHGGHGGHGGGGFDGGGFSGGDGGGGGGF